MEEWMGELYWMPNDIWVRLGRRKEMLYLMLWFPAAAGLVSLPLPLPMAPLWMNLG